MDDNIILHHGDCIEVMRQMPDDSVDLVLTDPPYNIKVATRCDGRRSVNQWDVITDYMNWNMVWLKECQRVLKSNGVLYFWHNDMSQIADLLARIKVQTDFKFISFCIWDKGDSYRAHAWFDRRPDGDTALRSWFNICEYCLHFFNNPQIAGRQWAATGLDRINSSPESYRPIKEWYAAELKRLGLAKQDIAIKYTEATGKKPHMLNHYFCDSQFEIPTKEIWESVYEPLGFKWPYEELRGSYEKLKKSYEELRKSYKEQRNTHVCDQKHCNIWHVPPIPSNKRYHTCQKPVPILERIIRVSSRRDGTVLDCFAGSGSTGVACIETGRKFIGIERDEGYYDIMRKRIEDCMLAYTE